MNQNRTIFIISSLTFVLSIMGFVIESSVWYIWGFSLLFSIYLFLKEMLNNEPKKKIGKNKNFLSFLWFIVIGLLAEIALSLTNGMQDLFYVYLFFAIIVCNIIFYLINKCKES